MQKTWCDNCNRELKLNESDKPEISSDDWKPDVLCRLELRIVGKGLAPIDLDLCARCARKYLRVLKKPMDEE